MARVLHCYFLRFGGVPRRPPTSLTRFPLAGIDRRGPTVVGGSGRRSEVVAGSPVPSRATGRGRRCGAASTRRRAGSQPFPARASHLAPPNAVFFGVGRRLRTSCVAAPRAVFRLRPPSEACARASRRSVFSSAFGLGPPCSRYTPQRLASRSGSGPASSWRPAPDSAVAGAPAPERRRGSAAMNPGRDGASTSWALPAAAFGLVGPPHPRRPAGRL